MNSLDDLTKKINNNIIENFKGKKGRKGYLILQACKKSYRYNNTLGSSYLLFALSKGNFVRQFYEPNVLKFPYTKGNFKSFASITLL